MKTLVCRGTPVTCAKDAADLLSAAGQDVTLRHRRIGGDMLVNAAIHDAVALNMIKLLPYLVAESRVRLVGHSLGACHALAMPAWIPRSVVPEIFAFAPFQCANAKFWKATYDGRPPPQLFGRSLDFAPGWDHLDPITVQPGPLQHLLGDGKVETVTVWPWLDESIGDHSVDRYVYDLEAVPGAEEAALMCRLASAVYLTDIADVLDRTTAMGFQTVDVVEESGFRCAVLECSQQIPGA